MLKPTIAIASLILFTSCVSVKSIIGPDGTENQLISCQKVEDCYAKATEICGKYKILNTTSEVWSGSTTVRLLVSCQH